MVPDGNEGLFAILFTWDRGIDPRNIPLKFYAVYELLYSYVSFPADD